QFADVPRIDELAVTEADKGLFFLLQAPFRIARPFAAPPGVPADRLKILQDAFMRTNADSDYLEEAKKLKLDISPRPGAEVATVVEEAYRLPPELVKRYVDTLAQGD